MSKNKPSIPKGTRDFGPEEMIRRQFILKTIEHIFKKYGFLPLETPAMENLSVLTGKYGEEGDQLLFKILNSGDFLSKVKPEDIKSGYKKIIPQISEKGLRYDLTVPLARYVVMNQHDITMPFKRYQMQPVWRADRPQKGRYREFYQCDADVIGTTSLLCEAEIIAMISEVFKMLGIKKYRIKINHRSILKALAMYIGEANNEAKLCVALDKLEKIGWEKVEEHLEKDSFSKSSIQKLKPFFNADITLQQVDDKLQTLPEAQKGISDLKRIFELVDKLKVSNSFYSFDISLARGLSYYTGAIFEVTIDDVSIGSVSGGGRYDELTDIFGVKGVSGVGFSFGVDRIYDVMQELDLFSKDLTQTTQALIISFDQSSEPFALETLASLRKENISSELYPEYTKLKKQLNYANKKNIPFVILIGSEEVQSNKLTVKNMRSGTQQTLTINEVIEILKDNIDE